jgi:hypothetical protein
MTSNALYSRMPVSARNTLAAMADLSTALLSQLVKGPATPPPNLPSLAQIIFPNLR